MSHFSIIEYSGEDAGAVLAQLVKDGEKEVQTPTSKTERVVGFQVVEKKIDEPTPNTD